MTPSDIVQLFCRVMNEFAWREHEPYSRECTVTLNLKGFLILRALVVVRLGATNESPRVAGAGRCRGRTANVAQVNLHAVYPQICHTRPARRCSKQHSCPHCRFLLLGPLGAVANGQLKRPFAQKREIPHPRLSLRCPSQTDDRKSGKGFPQTKAQQPRNASCVAQARCHAGGKRSSIPGATLPRRGHSFLSDY